MTKFLHLSLAVSLFFLKAICAESDSEHSPIVVSRTPTCCEAKPDSFWLQTYSIVQSITPEQITAQGLASVFENLEADYATSKDTSIKHQIRLRWNILTTIFTLKKISSLHSNQALKVSQQTMPMAYFPIIGSDFPQSLSADYLRDSNNSGCLLTWHLNSVEKLIHLKQVIPESIISNDEWGNILAFAEAVFLIKSTQDSTPSRKSHASDVECYGENSYFVSKLIEVWLETKDQIQSHFGDNEAIVSVGNTPSYLVELLRIDSAQRGGTILNVPISGHPGIARRVDGWMSDLVTPEGLKSYREYLQHIGFYNLIHTIGSISFIDLVGQGGGVAFLINELRARAIEVGINIDEKIKVICMNQKKSFDFYGIRVAPENCVSLNVEAGDYSLFDQCEDQLRITPSLPGWRWDQDLQKTVRIPHTHGAQAVIRMLRASTKIRT